MAIVKIGSHRIRHVTVWEADMLTDLDSFVGRVGDYIHCLEDDSWRVYTGTLVQNGAPPAEGGATWGAVTGTLEDQTDLQTALDGKAASNHNHALNNLSEKSYNSLTDKPTIPSLSGAWPVGSIFISVDSTNPGTSLGFGTWSAFGAGRVLVGRDAGQTEFDTVEETGGAKTHTLQISEIPAHTHVISSQTATTGSATSYEHGALDTSSAEAEVTEVTGSTGGGGAHNNLQPYIVVYMWKRTA